VNAPVEVADVVEDAVETEGHGKRGCRTPAAD
jgi:hypothetical protein